MEFGHKMFHVKFLKIIANESANKRLFISLLFILFFYKIKIEMKILFAHIFCRKDNIIAPNYPSYIKNV